MSDEGERTCPLCAEEMDLTDQQLKPCKCGYEICVWCWHQIMDMAAKDDTEGRCPACRSPYDKEKIVGMAANCERLVAEVHMERKMKNQKVKSKSSEARKQLTSVRVIQRNLVYIVGLPLNLADEDLLQQREYFGQYGQVLKVSMSRTAAGVVQQFPNSTCSVYITYSKEEEAIRCIQNVHGFVLEGRPLRACFGTTKYCHAWLRNMPCSNPDCLYLHEVGSQEDSFTKDEIISAYTRSRVQQITGAANNMQRRSGNVLPTPLDDWSNNSSVKPIVKNASSTSVNILRGSPPNGSSGKPIALPSDAWGTRATNCQPTVGAPLCPNELTKPEPDTISSTVPFSAAVSGTTQASLTNDVMKRPVLSNGNHSMPDVVKNELSKPVKQYKSMDILASASEKTLASDRFSAVNTNKQFSSLPLADRDSDRSSHTSKNITNSVSVTEQSCGSGPEKAIVSTSEEIENLSYELSSVCIGRTQNEHCSLSKPSSPPPGIVLAKSIQSKGSRYNTDKYRDAIITNATGKADTLDTEVCSMKEQSDFGLDSQPQVLSTNTEVEDDVTIFDNQRHKDPEVVCLSYLPKTASILHASNQSSPHLRQHGEPCNFVNAGSLYANDKIGDDSQVHASNILCNGYSEKSLSTRSYGFLHDERNDQCIGRLIGDSVNIGSDATKDKGESSIISNILSMEFDSWDDSLTSPESLARLLGDNNDNQNAPLKKSSSWKVQSNNQSRFSFARREDSKIQAFNTHPYFGDNQQFSRSGPIIHDFMERDLSMDKLGTANGFHANNLDESGNLASGHFIASNNKLSAVSRAQVSAPPGFSVPNRAPPPGFSSLERIGQAFDSLSGGNSLLDPLFLRNSYQNSSTGGNIGGAGLGDIQSMDPAILAVGKGRIQGAPNGPAFDMRSNYPEQLSYFENEARLQLLMQRSLSPQQNLRFSEIGNAFSQLGDSYGFSSRLNQPQVSLASFPQLSLQQSRNAVLPNGQWDGWNEVQSGNSLSVAELFRNEGLGFNKLYRGYDDSKFRMPNSSDLYNGTFGI